MDKQMRRPGIWALTIACLALTAPAHADDHTLQRGGLTATVNDEFSVDSDAVSHIDVVVTNNSSSAYKNVTISIGLYNHANGIIATTKNATPKIAAHGTWIFTIALRMSSTTIGRYRILSLKGTH